MVLNHKELYSLKYYSESEVCICFNLSRTYLWKCRKNGLPFIKVGTRNIRYNLDDVLSWFNSQNQNGSGGAA